MSRILAVDRRLRMPICVAALVVLVVTWALLAASTTDIAYTVRASLVCQCHLYRTGHSVTVGRMREKKPLTCNETVSFKGLRSRNISIRSDMRRSESGLPPAYLVFPLSAVTLRGPDKPRFKTCILILPPSICGTVIPMYRQFGICIYVECSLMFI